VSAVLRSWIDHGGRRSLALLGLVVAEAALALAFGVAGLLAEGGHREEQQAARAVASALGLTDLALFSGASYTRHPSQADRFAPFSDHPAAFEHSPAGSVLPPPPAPSPARRPSGRPP